MTKLTLLVIMSIVFFSCSKISTVIDGKVTEDKIYKWASEKNMKNLFKCLRKPILTRDCGLMQPIISV